MLIKGYSDFSMEAPGCCPGSPLWRAEFQLDGDVTGLFPYINGVAENAVYYEEPHYVQFMLNGYGCALYPDKALARIFQDREEAVKFIEGLIEFLNDLDARKDSLEPDNTKRRPVPVLEVFRLLPRTNCQKCGLSTCMAFAAALGIGEAAADDCPDLTDLTNGNTAKIRAMLSGS